MDWCPRCGRNKHSGDGPCALCWEGRATSDEVMALADLAASRDQGAARVLAMIDDERAAPALRSLTEHPNGVVREGAVRCLAWMNVPEDSPLAFLAVADSEPRVRRAGYGWLADLASDEAIAALESASEEGYFGELRDEALAWARDPEAGARARRERTNAHTDHLVRAEPLEPRTVPREAFDRLVEDPPERGIAVPAKFGGQPDWIGEPVWPMGPGDRPLVFFGQLPVPGTDATAYLFFSQDEEVLSAEPLSDGNAVVVQPGPAPHMPTVRTAQGPQLYEAIHDWSRYWVPAKYRPYCRWLVTVSGADPEHWSWPDPPEGKYIRDERGDWNKIGGTPLFLQGDEGPPGEGWRFGFQFTADWVAEELADGAAVYGFFRDDGSGAMLWQCH